MAAGASLPYPSSDDILNGGAQGAGPQVPQQPPIQGQGAGPATAPPQAQPTTPGQPAAQGLGAGQTEAGIADSAKGQKGEIPTPDVQMKFKPDKLAKAQTTLDVLNAATSKSRKDYMDWWEKQYGDIDDKYDHLKTQLGARPSDDEPQTKKEKFAALLEFGLHLMKASAQPTSNQGAVGAAVLSDEHDAATAAHQKNIQGQQAAYDANANAIEQGRADEQKGIGTPAQAMKASDDQAKTAAAATKDQAGALKSINDVDTQKASALGAPTYAVGPGGVIHSLSRDEDGKAHAEPVTGIDGKPFAGRVLGRTTGSGVDTAGKDPAAIRTFKYATGVLGIDANDAAPILGIKPSGHPQQDHTSVYNHLLSVTMGDTDKAKRGADQYVIDKYGAGALQRTSQAPVPTNAPPPQALNGLKPGSIRDFGANGKWTIGIDGKPRQVSGGPQTIQ